MQQNNNTITNINDQKRSEILNIRI